MTGENHPARKYCARDAAGRYAAAVCSAGAGLALRFALADILGPTVPYMTVFPGVMFAAWFGGLGPGMLATFLSVAGVLSFFIPRVPGNGTIRLADAAGA
ncbi:MAG: DUF4118 domain-containing protein, partial [Acidobacteriota bacterium]